MSRIRNVKPSIWKHENLHDAEYYTGLPLVVGFISLWNVCDREGRFKWKVRSLKSDCMPLRDEVNFESVLDALCSLGMVSKFLVKGEYYGLVDNFIEHQAISTSEKKSNIICLKGGEKIDPMTLDQIIEKYKLTPIDSSRFPEGQTKDRLESDSRQTEVSQTKDIGRMTYDVGLMTNDKKTHIYQEAEGAEEIQEDWVESIDSDYVFPCFAKIPKKYHEDIENILNHWSETMDIKIDLTKHPKTNEKRARLIKDTLVEGYTPEECKRAVTGCYRSDHHMGKNKQGTKYNAISNIFRHEKEVFARFLELGTNGKKGFDEDIDDEEFDRISRELKLGKYANGNDCIDGEVVQHKFVN